jgi:pectinesterase
MSKISTLSLFLLLLTFFLPVCTAHASSITDDLQNNCLKVPVNQFVGSLTSTLDIIRDVISIISNFGNVFGDIRLTNAITDCLDLLDFSADELSWSMSASQNPNGKEQHPLLGIQS